MREREREGGGDTASRRPKCRSCTLAYLGDHGHGMGRDRGGIKSETCILHAHAVWIWWMSHRKWNNGLNGPHWPGASFVLASDRS